MGNLAPPADAVTLTAGTRVAVFLRSLGIQGSWNYRTLMGTGFAFSLLPALRKIYGNDPTRLEAAVTRHSELFNSHPYLAPIALGAVARLESESADPAVIDRFKSAVRGSLGTLGDRLVWAGWRPVCVLLAFALLLAGLPWWLGVGAFLVLYNAGHVWLRLWAYAVGWREGMRVAERLRRSPIGPAQRILALAGAFLVGTVIPLAIAGRMLGTTPRWPWIVASIGAAALGAAIGGRIRGPLALGLGLLTLLGILLGTVQ